MPCGLAVKGCDGLVPAVGSCWSFQWGLLVGPLVLWVCSPRGTELGHATIHDYEHTPDNLSIVFDLPPSELQYVRAAAENARKAHKSLKSTKPQQQPQAELLWK